MKDLTKLEYSYFIPLVLLVLWLGIAPNVVMDKVSPSVEKLIGQYESGLGKKEMK